MLEEKEYAAGHEATCQSIATAQSPKVKQERIKDKPQQQTPRPYLLVPGRLPDTPVAEDCIQNAGYQIRKPQPERIVPKDGCRKLREQRVQKMIVRSCIITAYDNVLYRLLNKLKPRDSFVVRNGNLED